VWQGGSNIEAGSTTAPHIARYFPSTDVIPATMFSSVTA
jgi:hypothetical protein